MVGMIWDVGIATASFYDNDGFLAIQYDAEGTEPGGDGGVEPYEAHGFGGLIHRPLDPVLDDNGTPNASKSSSVLFGMDGGRGHAFPLDNPDVVKNLPTIAKGETLLHSDFGQFVRLLADGSIALYTTTAGGPPTFPDGTPAQSVQLVVGPNGLSYLAPWGSLTFDANGFHVLTKAGARLDLGGVYGLPAPLDKTNTYAALQAGTITLDGSAVHCGPDTGASGPIASATALLAWLTGTLVPALVTIAGATGTGAGVATPAAAAVGASLSALTTSLATSTSSS